jgi:hypothetical protein
MSRLFSAWALGLSAFMTAAGALGQSAPAATVRAPGIYLRAAVLGSSMNPEGLTYRAERGSESTAPGSFTGKQLGFGRVLLPGFSVGVHVDGHGFHLGVGADLYARPDVTLLNDAQVGAGAVAWVRGGPRVVVGPVALLAALRLGAHLQQVERRAGTEVVTYDSAAGVYALDLGVAWRPIPWVQLDAIVGYDLGTLSALTASVAVNVGWSRR